MRIKGFIGFLALCTLFAGCCAETTLTLDTTTEMMKLEPRGKEIFKFMIPENPPEGKHLVFDVTGAEDSTSDPDVFISSVAFLFTRRKLPVQASSIASGSAWRTGRTSAWFPRTRSRPTPPSTPVHSSSNA